MGCDILNQSKESSDRSFKDDVFQKPPEMKGAKASMKLELGAKLMFSVEQKVPLPLERKIRKTIGELLLLGIFEPVEAAGVDICFPVVCVRKGDKLRLCLTMKYIQKVKLLPKPTPYRVLKPFSEMCQELNVMLKLISLTLIRNFH